MKNTTKIDKINNKKYPNNNEFDNIVLEILYKRGIVRRCDLRKQVMNKTWKSRKYSESTIEHKIDGMRERGVITVIKGKKLDKYNIKNPKKKAAYYIPTQISGLEDHFSKVFDLLKSDSLIKKKTAVKDFDIYGDRCLLTPDKLDILARELINEDDELRYHLLRILKNQIVYRGIRPKNTAMLIENLKIVLDCYPVLDGLSKDYKQLRYWPIWILASYNDTIIFEQLVKDAWEVQDLESFFECYKHASLSPIIEEHRTELLNLEIELIEGGKETVSNKIGEIRRIAAEDTGMRVERVEEKINDSEGW